jgi:ACDE family multidrug resistance protein
LRQRKIYRDVSLQIVFGVTLMAVLGVSSITPAFPKIVDELGISEHSIGLLITVFTFPGIILTPVLGVLADRHGRKKILVPSLMLFGIAGGACAFAPNFDILLILRLFQGIGAASLGSLNATIIGDLYSGEERTTALGYNASVLSIGVAGYPVIGGALALAGWHYPFILPVIAIPIGLIVLFSLKSPEPRNEQSLREYLESAIRSMKNREVIVLSIGSIFTFIILYGSYLTYFPLLVGATFGSSTFIIGLIMSSVALTTALVSMQLGNLTRMFSKRAVLQTAFVLYTLSLLAIPFVSNLWTMLIPTVIFGIAHGLNVPTIQALLTGLAPPEYRAAFMSVNEMVFRVGQTIGPILIGGIYLIGGVDGAFFAGALLSLGMVLLVSATIKT